MAASTLPFPFEAASPSVRLRVVRDLWGDTPPRDLVEEVLADPPVRRLARAQRRDGTWESWLHHGGDSVENAVGELAERGCPPGDGPLARALPRVRAFARGDDRFFVDLGGRPGPVRLGFLRRLAWSLLAHAGLGDEAEVRARADREVDRAHRWVRRVRAEGMTAGGARRGRPLHAPSSLDADGLPVPDLHWLRLCAFVPSLRGDARVRDVLRFVAEPPYQRLAARGLGWVRDGGRIRACGWGIALPSPARLLERGELARGLWLTELFLLCGVPGPVSGLVRAVARARDSDGLLRAPTSAARTPRAYGILGGWVRLSEPWRARARAIDLTFRALRVEHLARVARLARADSPLPSRT